MAQRSRGVVFHSQISSEKNMLQSDFEPEEPQNPPDVPNAGVAGDGDLHSGAEQNGANRDDVPLGDGNRDAPQGRSQPDRDASDGSAADTRGALMRVEPIRIHAPDASPAGSDEEPSPRAAHVAIRREPLIYQAGFLADLLVKVVALLTAAGIPFFARGNQLVRVDHPGSTFAPERAKVVPVTDSHLIRVLSQLATFWKPKSRSKAEPIDAPAPLIRAMLTAEQQPFRPLRRLSEIPILLGDGRVVDTPGYDVGSGTFYAPDPRFRMAPLPERPDLEDARGAVALLTDLLCDVPVSSHAALSAAISAVVTPVVRSAIQGCVPVFATDCAVARAGKTEIAQLAAHVEGGGPASVQPMPSDIELEKRITMHILDGDRMVVFDNMTRPVGGPVLEALATANEWTGRKIGTSQQIRAPNLMTIHCNGNHLALHNDMTGRVVLIRLGTDLEFPGERPLKRPDVRQWTLEHRGELVAAAITLCRAYILAGTPDVGLSPMHSFDSWSTVVRSALVWTGLPDPLEDIRRLRSEMDPETQAHGTVLAQLALLFPGGKHFTARDVQLAAACAGNAFAETVERMLADALEIACHKKPEAMNPLELGLAIKQLTDKNVGGLLMRRLRSSGEGNVYQVVRIPRNK